MKRLFAALAGGCMLLAGAGAHAADKVMYQEPSSTKISPESESLQTYNSHFLENLNQSNNPFLYDSASQSFDRFYNEIFSLASTPIKDEYEKTIDYLERINYKNRLNILKKAFPREIIIIKPYYNGDIKYDPDSEILKVEVGNLSIRFLERNFLDTTIFSRQINPKLYFGVQCRIEESVKLSSENAQKIKDTMKFEAAIKFVPNFDFPKTVEGNRAHEGFRNLRTSIKIDTHPAYYKIQEETIGLKPQYGKVTSFIPNWKSATLYLLDSTTKQIILQKECQIINL